MNKLVYLLERTLNSKSKNLTKADEYMFYSPFVSHYKPKLQVNIESQKWHCWVSNQGGHSIYSLFKKVNADTRYFAELKDLVFIPNKSKGETESKVIVSLPRDFQALWKVSKSLYRNQAKSFLHKRGITPHIQIHDELDISRPIGEEDNSKDIIQVMEKAVDLQIPNKVDYESGPNWGSIK